MKRYKRIESAFMESFIKDQNENMKIISKVLKQNDIDFCFIGGAILPEYGYNRTTEDIDILISKSDKDKFLKLAGTYLKRKFKDAQKSFYWNNPKIQIDIIYSGDKAGDMTKGIEYKEPYEIDMVKNSIPKLTLENLIQYKLCSGLYGKGRLKDFGDVQQLIIINDLDKEFANSFRKDLKNKYIEIWEDETK